MAEPTEPTDSTLLDALPFQDGETITLDPTGSWPKSDHRFDLASAWAVKTALDAERPLLLRGEPGIGKSQLARAVAAKFKVPFLSHVVDERSERDDLLYHYDAIARLAEAQICGIGKPTGDEWKAQLKEENFLEPGILWWAYNWDSASQRANALAKAGRQIIPPTAPDDWTANDPDKPCGPVVLIDEIDKADPSVPNGLLESLGNGGFDVRQLGRAIRVEEGRKMPLVFITTNEERELPVAFLRRCLVLHMNLPDDPTDFLLKRARVTYDKETLSDDVIREVVRQLVQDREATGAGLAKPGAAEFLDIIKVLAQVDNALQLEALEKIKVFAWDKNRVERS